MKKKFILTVAAAVLITVVAFAVVRYALPTKSVAETAALKMAASQVSLDKEQTSAPAKQLPPGKGMSAVENAAEHEKYLYILFYREDNEQTRSASNIVETTRRKVGRKAEWIAINAADPSEKEIVKKFNASRAPMPLVLAVAPNGAITGGFPREFDENQLKDAIVSKGAEQTLKALQDRKMVLLCAQNGATRNNVAAMRGVQDFKKDAQYARSTEIVTVDPSDPAEARFLSQLRVDPNIDEATTVFLTPPGQTVATYKGALQKNQLVASLQAVKSGRSGGGCGPVCPPGACGPTGKKGK